MTIHKKTAILMWTTGVQGFDTLPYIYNINTHTYIDILLYVLLYIYNLYVNVNV